MEIVYLIGCQAIAGNAMWIEKDCRLITNYKVMRIFEGLS